MKKDYLNFLQWFVKEQIEEENLTNYLMDKITLAGGENAKVMLCIKDKDLEKLQVKYVWLRT
jgi:ferritin